MISTIIKKVFHRQEGLSIVEIVLASGIFIIFSSGAVISLIQALNANRLGLEFTIASEYATEGLEAVRSLKNQDFANLTNTTQSGVTILGGTWAWNGVGSTVTHGKPYTRTITIEDVRRDSAPPAGNIVATGGTIDSDSKKITSTVTWNFTSARPESVSFTTYLSDWRKAIAITNGLIVYGDTTSVGQPRYRLYTDASNSFSSEASTGNSFSDSIVGKTFKIKTSPTKQEAIAGYVNNSGILRILCFNGTTWSSEWTTTVGGNGTNDQRFAMGYEKTTGDVIVVYSRNTATTNEMGYRTKPGSMDCGSENWANETTLDPTRTSGIVHWIRMETQPTSGSNTIALAWADANSDLSAMQWTGSSFGIAEPTAALENNLERVSSSQDVQSFDISYESTSGNLMVVWGLSQASTCTAGATIATTNCIRYARYTNSWSSVAVIPTVADPATNIDISAHPNTNELVVAALDNNQADLSLAYWSGSNWTGKANQDTSARAVTAGSKRIATGWLISGGTTRSVITYNDSGATNIGWVVGNNGVFTTQTDFAPSPLFANPQQWYDIQMDPTNTDRLMFTLADNNSDVFAKRLVMSSTAVFTWSNADNSAYLENSLGQASTSPFAFTYWRN